MKRNTFSKEERLCSKRLIADLFQHGSSFFIYPYRITFQLLEGLEHRTQVLFSAPKRRFPHAVQRNLLKRRMREAYRLQKNEILHSAIGQSSFGLVVAFQYVGKGLEDYALMHTRMADVLRKLRDLAP